MSDQVRFTEQEENELRLAMKNGGIFLKLFADPYKSAEVLASDGNGSWKIITKMNRDITAKINALYNDQKVYKAAMTAGFRQVSLSWFIAEYC